MTTVSILPISDSNGKKFCRAISGDKEWVGKTAGQALDGLTDRLGQTEFSAVLVIQSFLPDVFFGDKQQKRLSELMSLWRIARDRGQTFPPEQQAELELLVDTELRATNSRIAALTQLG
jgi:hypothetical protein